jgi:hypothetical protein
VGLAAWPVRAYAFPAGAVREVQAVAGAGESDVGEPSLLGYRRGFVGWSIVTIKSVRGQRPLMREYAFFLLNDKYPVNAHIRLWLRRN